MNEAFAATVAGVAPVALLVMTVEIANSRKRLGALLFNLSPKRRLLTSLYEGDNEPTREQVLAVRDSLKVAPRGVWTILLTLGYVGSAVIAASALFDAEIAAIYWLSTPDAGPEPEVAASIRRSLMWGFLWVIASPQLMMLNAIYSSLFRGVALGEYRSRFSRDLRRFTADEERERRDPESAQAGQDEPPHGEDPGR